MAFKQGEFVRWVAEQDCGPIHRVVSVMSDGMIEISDFGGYFSPDLFIRVRNPIFGTDLASPLPEVVEEWRNAITKLRGQISDVSFEHRGWGEHLKCVEGLLTCGLIALHHVRETMIEAEKNIATKPMSDANLAAYHGDVDGDCDL